MPVLEHSANGIRYGWAGKSDRPVLVLSHSLGTDHRLWSRQVHSFGEHFRVLLYDQRGHGESESPSVRPWSIDDFGKDLLGVLDELQLECVHFCGISLGGMVGLWMAEKTPERLDRLVVANTAAHTEDPTLLKGRLRKIAESGLDRVADNVLDRWFSPGFHRHHPEAVCEFREILLGTPDEAYLATSEAICDMDLRSGLSRISTSTLVITGHCDKATPASWGKKIANEIPAAECCELNAAHLSNVEAAAAFNDAARRFLTA